MEKNYKEKLKSPLFSFVTPCLNTGIFLMGYVKSVLEQDYQEWELILVDDGSDEKTLKILKQIEKMDKRIQVYYCKHQGACEARNYGQDKAKGDIISFCASDFVVFPGTLRTWVNILNENPDADFVYNGYSVKGEGMDGQFGEANFLSQEFDPYLLKFRNYIDGSSPMRMDMARKIKWDPKIKSLQDYDWILQAVVNHKAKGIWIPEMLFTTSPPRKGGLSDDSSNNWLKRMDAVHAKYNIKVPDICVSSLGAPMHGKRIAKLIGADFQQYPMSKPNRYKMIYSLGFFAASVNEHLSVFAGFKGKKMIHWIGTDILQMQNIGWQANRGLVEWLNKNIDVQYSEVDFTQAELKEMDLETKILPFPVFEDYKVSPLPDKFSVGVYMPGANQEIYNQQLMLDVVNAMPDVKFKFFGDQGSEGKAANITYMGYIKDMKKFVKETSVLLRVTQHDGLPLGPCEFTQAGRNVIFNKKMPNWQYTTGELKDIIKQIRLAKKLPLNEKGAKHYAKYLDKDKFKRTINSYI